MDDQTGEQTVFGKVLRIMRLTFLCVAQKLLGQILKGPPEKF